jgi:hypothetical protein
VTFVVPIGQCLDCFHNTALLLASDGGAYPKRGSFGCLIATYDLVLVTAGGRAYGDDPRSFRAEAYGMLAALLLLHHLHLYFRIDLSLAALSHYIRKAR